MSVAHIVCSRFCCVAVMPAAGPRTTCSRSPARWAGPRTRRAGAAARSCASPRWQPSGPGSLLAAVETEGPAHRRVRSRRRHRPRAARDHDHRAVPHHRRPDGALARHHAHPRRASTSRRTTWSCSTSACAPARPARRSASGWEPRCDLDAGRRHDVIVDHCSLTWATDENLSASGTALHRQRRPRNGAAAPRTASPSATTSSPRASQYSTHAKGEHSKGSLIHDNVTDILIVGNLYAHNIERNPLFKGGVRGMVINNLIYNPGQRAVHYNLIAEEWRGQPYQVGQMALLGNVLRGGPSTPPGLAFFMLGGSGDIELYEDDNIAVDWVGRPMPRSSAATRTRAPASCRCARPALPFNVQLLPAADVQDAVIRNAGARPWDRDPVDAASSPTPSKAAARSSTTRRGRRLSAVQGNSRAVQGERMGPEVHGQEDKVTKVTLTSPPADTPRSRPTLLRLPARSPRPHLRA